MQEIKFHIDAPMLKYCQITSNSCCFSILASDFDITNQVKSDNAISNRIEESLTNKVCFRICIYFANAVLKNQKIVKGNQKLYYNLKMFINEGYLDILNDIS